MMPEVSEKDAMVDLEKAMERSFLDLFYRKYRLIKRKSYVEKGLEMNDLMTSEVTRDNGRETGAISKLSTLVAADAGRDADGFPPQMVWPRHPAPPVPDHPPNRGPNSNPPIMGASYVANPQHVKMEYLPDPPLF